VKRLLLLWLWALSASAQEVEQVYTCAADDNEADYAIYGVHVNPETAKWDASCFIGADQLDGGKRMIVDLRDEKAFNRFHIPGALNILPHHVKGKAFIRNRAVLLVDDGRGHKQAQAVCGELRELGVDATVLRGGLRHWRDQGRPLVGGR